MDNYMQMAQTLVTEWGLKLVYALAIFFIGRWLAGMLVGVAERGMTRSKLDATLIGFLKNIVFAVLMVFVVLAALNQLGIQTASFIAILGAAGLAIGLALQGSLSNFAAGVMLIMFRPFKVGDYIEAGGTAGTVEEIMLFNTRFRTPDNREIWVPNDAIVKGNIVNSSARDTRRVDMLLGVGYGDDLKKARAVIEEVLAADSRVLAEPAAVVAVSELAESSARGSPRATTGPSSGTSRKPSRRGSTRKASPFPSRSATCTCTRSGATPPEHASPDRLAR